MKLRNQIISGLAAVALIVPAVSGTAFAESSNYENGNYAAASAMYKDASGAINTASKSSCDTFFASTADVTLTDDSTIITWYVEDDADNDYGVETIDSFIATYDGTEYTAVIYSDVLVQKEINGATHNANPVVLTLPAEAIETATTDGLYIASYVPAMGSWGNVAYWAVLSDLTVTTAQSSYKASEVTATVEKNASTYTVTVPTSVSLGTLSRTEDKSVEFEVSVEANDFADDEYIEISAVASGKLVSSGDDEIAFANDFGTQTANETTSLTGNLSVLASDVANVAGGNYTGTTTFSISYYGE